MEYEGRSEQKAIIIHSHYYLFSPCEEGMFYSPTTINPFSVTVVDGDGDHDHDDNDDMMLL